MRSVLTEAKPAKAWYFSFGINHTHEVDGVTLDWQSLVAITAPSAGAARALMFATFGRRWAFQRSELPEDWPAYFPRGVVLELEVANPDQAPEVQP